MSMCYNCAICENAYSTNYFKVICITIEKYDNINIKTSLRKSLFINKLFKLLNLKFPELDTNQFNKIKYQLWESIYTETELNSCLCKRQQN